MNKLIIWGIVIFLSSWILAFSGALFMPMHENKDWLYILAIIAFFIGLGMVIFGALKSKTK